MLDDADELQALNDKRSRLLAWRKWVVAICTLGVLALAVVLPASLLTQMPPAVFAVVLASWFPTLGTWIWIDVKVEGIKTNIERLEFKAKWESVSKKYRDRLLHG